MNRDRVHDFEKVCEPGADEQLASVLPKEVKKSGRRWFVLALAALAGFMGSGGAMSGGAIITVLVGLFIAVFLLALAYSMVTEPSAFDPDAYVRDIPRYSDAVNGAPQGEAVYGSS